MLSSAYLAALAAAADRILRLVDGAAADASADPAQRDALSMAGIGLERAVVALRGAAAATLAGEPLTAQLAVEPAR